MLLNKEADSVFFTLSSVVLVKAMTGICRRLITCLWGIEIETTGFTYGPVLLCCVHENYAAFYNKLITCWRDAVNSWKQECVKSISFFLYR